MRRRPRLARSPDARCSALPSGNPPTTTTGSPGPLCVAGSCGQPTQSLYHVPLPLLNSTAGGANLVVIFEETNAPPGAAPPPPPEGLGPGALPVRAFSRNVSAVSFVVLTQHPALD